MTLFGITIELIIKNIRTIVFKILILIILDINERC